MGLSRPCMRRHPVLGPCNRPCCGLMVALVAPYVPCKPPFKSRAAPHLALTNVRKKPSPLCYREVRVLSYVCRKQFSTFCWIFCPGYMPYRGFSSASHTSRSAHALACSRPQSFPSGAWSQKSRSSSCDGMSTATPQLLARHALFRSRAGN